MGRGARTRLSRLFPQGDKQWAMCWAALSRVTALGADSYLKREEVTRCKKVMNIQLWLCPAPEKSHAFSTVNKLHKRQRGVVLEVHVCVCRCMQGTRDQSVWREEVWERIQNVWKFHWCSACELKCQKDSCDQDMHCIGYNCLMTTTLGSSQDWDNDGKAELSRALFRKLSCAFQSPGNITKMPILILQFLGRAWDCTNCQVMPTLWGPWKEQGLRTQVSQPDGLYSQPTSATQYLCDLEQFT